MIELLDISYDEIGVIRELWEKNRQYHEETSEYFKESYRDICFDQRIKGFGEYERDNIKITVAKDENGYVGYCISTHSNGKGEVESLHVYESCRGKGIGKQLVKSHLDWLNQLGCTVIGVTVSQENASTIEFYRKLGFYPNTLYMQQKL